MTRTFDKKSQTCLNLVSDKDFRQEIRHVRTLLVMRTFDMKSQTCLNLVCDKDFRQEITDMFEPCL